MLPDDETDVNELVRSVFDEFVAPGYSNDGILAFKKLINTGSFIERLNSGSLVMLAISEQKIIGILELRNYSHIALLFVEKSFQRLGIAQELCRRSVELCRKLNPELQEITVNSSPNALGAYQQIGFTPTEDEKENNGIRFTPMALKIE
jgi:GNAT superfamily N-acetyltransferase